MSFLQALMGKPNVDKLSARRNIPGLIRAFGYEKDFHVRDAAEDALVQIGVPAVPALIRSLNDQNKSRRDAAIRSLGRIGDIRAVAPLLRLLAEDCYFTSKALARIGSPEALQPLLRILQDPQASQASIVEQASVMEALRLANAPQLAGTLCDLLLQELARGYSGNPNSYLQYNYSRESDRQFNNDRKIEYCKGAIGAVSNYKTGRVIFALKMAQADAAEAVGSAAREALEKLKLLPGAVEGLQPLVALLDSADPKIRTSAEQALVEFGDASLAEAVQARLHSMGDETRQAAARIMAALGLPSATQALVDQLMDRDAGIRLAAAHQLANAGREPANIREQAYLAVARGEYWQAERLGARGMEPLLDVIREVSGEDAWRAVESCARIGGPAVPVLAAVLKSRKEEQHTRIAAVHALAQIQDARCPALLLQALQDKDWWVGQEAIQPLAALGDPSAREVLVQTAGKWIRQGNVHLAEEVRTALERAGDARGVQNITQALEQAQLQKDIAFLKDGIVTLQERCPERGRNLENLVKEMSALMYTPEKAGRLPAGLLAKLAALPDAEDVESEISTDPHDSYFSVLNWYPRKVDCAQLRDLANQELKRR